MDNNKTTGGTGIFGVLFIVFLILKLTNVIDWSWWWVFSPLWIPLCILVICAIALIVLSE